MTITKDQFESRKRIAYLHSLFTDTIAKAAKDSGEQLTYSEIQLALCRCIERIASMENSDK